MPKSFRINISTDGQGAGFPDIKKGDYLVLGNGQNVVTAIAVATADAFESVEGLEEVELVSEADAPDVASVIRNLTPLLVGSPLQSLNFSIELSPPGSTERIRYLVDGFVTVREQYERTWTIQIWKAKTHG